MHLMSFLRCRSDSSMERAETLNIRWFTWWKWSARCVYDLQCQKVFQNVNTNGIIGPQHPLRLSFPPTSSSRHSPTPASPISQVLNNHPDYERLESENGTWNEVTMCRSIYSDQTPFPWEETNRWEGWIFWRRREKRSSSHTREWCTIYECAAVKPNAWSKLFHCLNSLIIDFRWQCMKEFSPLMSLLPDVFWLFADTAMCWILELKPCGKPEYILILSMRV